MMSRRNIIKAGAMVVASSGIGAKGLSQTPATRNPLLPGQFWPNGARLVISLSMQMEGGAQPASGADSPMPRIDSKYPDLPASKWYDYGYKEGLPRLLDVLDRRNVKATSHMVGAAVDLHPSLAREIVERGHEAAGHGQTWTA